MHEPRLHRRRADWQEAARLQRRPLRGGARGAAPAGRGRGAGLAHLAPPPQGWFAVPGRDPRADVPRGRPHAPGLAGPRRDRPRAGGGGAARERGALPRHLRERSGRRVALRSHRPLHPRQPALLRHPRLPARGPGGAIVPRRHPPGRRHRQPRTLRRAHARRDRQLPPGETLRPSRRQRRVDGHHRGAAARHGRAPHPHHRGHGRHHSAQAARGAAAARQRHRRGGQPRQGRVPGQRQPRDPHPDERHPRA